MNRVTSLVLFFVCSVGPLQVTNAQRGATKAFVSDLKAITDIMVYDVTSPVAAARYYAYSTLASYEIVAAQEAHYQSFFPFFKQPPQLDVQLTVPLTNPKKAYRYAMLLTASKLLPSGKKLLPKIEALQQHLTSKEQATLEAYTTAVVNYANTDGFLQLNNLKRYTPKRGEGYWQPTKPAFMAPVEPNWNTIRPFFLSAANQFLTKSPEPFDMTPQSEFYRLTQEVREVVDLNDKKYNEIAAFWDCNPYAISQVGHLEFGLKKISPGGHWIGIAGIATRKAKMTLPQTIFTHTLLSVALHDAFIACWDEKYRSDRIRPETVINRYMDPAWTPLLQTPPFPEYVSGHSVISTTAAEILTLLIGDDFRFRDTSEKEYGLKTRSYKSFRHAAEEACISRLYGGIHFMDAIDQGAWQGKKVAELIIAATTAMRP